MKTMRRAFLSSIHQTEIPMHRLFAGAVLLLPLVMFAGCSNSTSNEETYSLKGKVVALDRDRKTIEIDHEEIPGYMRAMKMPFGVDDLKALDGLASGDVVEGKFKVVAGKRTLIELRKTSAASAMPQTVAEKEAALIKANLDTLSAEDRKIAEWQRECPNGGPLGLMGVPIKLTVKGQPVFICCEHCKEDVEKNPDDMLKRVADSKKKNN
jgi:Cu/Ag efflux protein CusF